MRPELLRILAAGLIFLAGRVQADEWPQRPVKMIVSQAAGASPDV